MRYLLPALMVIAPGCLPEPEKPIVRPTGTSRNTLSNAPNALKARKAFRREKFEELVLGKTEEEVVKVAGKPDKKIEGTTEPHWLYYDTTKETETTNLDLFVSIYFKNGVVDRVDY